MTIYVDIDGTLTRDGEGPNGEPRQDIINVLQSAIAFGHEVVVWSAQGGEYAEGFCREHHIHPTAALGKPDIYVDDRESIRGPGAKHPMVWIKPDGLSDWLVANGYMDA